MLNAAAVAAAVVVLAANSQPALTNATAVMGTISSSYTSKTQVYTCSVIVTVKKTIGGSVVPSVTLTAVWTPNTGTVPATTTMASPTTSTSGTTTIKITSPTFPPAAKGCRVNITKVNTAGWQLTNPGAGALKTWP